MVAIHRRDAVFCLSVPLIAVFVVTIASSIHQAHSGKVNGGWGSWSEWSGYAKGLCAGNQRVKTRGCTNPMPSTDGSYCNGDNSQLQAAPIDGGLSEWTQWSTCEKPCGGSTVNRKRTCDEPAPQNGGKPCSGTVQETKLECLMPCADGKTDGKWSAWSAWTSCPSSCMTGGGAVITRYRQCNTPPPMNNGAPCPGNATDSQIACFNSCPRNGGFGLWSAWSECSTTCGAGSQHRNRFCNNPEPSETGKNCTGDFTTVQFCKVKDCYNQINGNWGAWSSYSTCTEPRYCNKGTKERKRTCSNPTPANGGLACPGPDIDTLACPTQAEGCSVFVPTPVPLIPTQPDEYIAKECGGSVKYSVLGTNGANIPKEVMTHLAFNSPAFKGGYFYMRPEEKGTVLKYCFEPYPSVTIEDVGKLITSYDRVLPLIGQRKLDKKETILGFSIRVYNKTGFALKGYDFGLYTASKYHGGNNVNLYDVMFTYYSEGAHYGNLAKGKLKIFDPRIFDCAIFLNRSNAEDLQTMRCNTSEMILRDFFQLIKLPDPIKPIYDALMGLGVWGFKFGPVEIVYEFRNEFLSPFVFSATKYVDGIPLYFDIICIPNLFNPKLALGFTFDHTSFGVVIEKATAAKGPAGEFLNALGLNIAVGVAYNPDILGAIRVTAMTRFRREPLFSTLKWSIPPGFHIAAQLALPKDCNGGSFCEICKKILGPKVKFRMVGTIRSGYYKVTAGFHEIRLTDNVEFYRLEMFVEVNHNATNKYVTLGLRAEVRIQVNKGEIVSDGMVLTNQLRLGGMLKHKLGSTDVTGTLFMIGMWRKAFGVSWFNMGNIIIGMTITIGSPIPITGFQFGATLEFGNNCLYNGDFAEDGHCLKLKVYFGVGKVTYFFGEASAVTVGKIMRMVGSSASLPAPVKESGFPEGLAISYAPAADVDLVSIGGPYVYKGVRFKGKLNIMGYKIFAEVWYAPEEIYINANCDPINLGGYVMVSRNKSHPQVGPAFYFHYRQAPPTAIIKIPFLKIYFEGYANVFGIEASCYVNITLEAFEIYIYGKAWNLIYAELYISASYDVFAITDAHFYVRVIVDLRGIADALKAASDAVDKAFKAAQASIRSAIDKVKKEKQKCKEKMTLKCDNCRSLKCKEAEENCKGFLDKAGKWIGGAFNAAGKWITKTGQKIKDGLAKVGNGIKKAFSGWRKRRDLIAQRDADFDHHVRNKRFVSKLICEGLVGGSCRGIEEFCYGSCKAVEHIGKGLCNVLDIAVGALRLAEAASGWINAAIKFLLEMFVVHGIRFELGLGKRFAGGFMVAADIDITLFGNRMHFGFAFDLQNPIKSITSSSDSGLYRYKEGVRQQRTGSIYDAYDKPNPYSDFDLSGGFGIEAVQSAADIRTGACLSVDSKSSGSKVIQVPCNSTDTKQKWAFTLKGTLMNAYSSKCLDLQSKVGDYAIQKDCSENANSQLLECHVVTRTVKGRRSDLCMTTATKISPTGPGSIGHLGSLKCIHATPRNTLVIKNGCSQPHTEFQMNEKGHIIHKSTGYCVRPAGGKTVNGAELELYTSGCHEFAFTKLGSIQHVQSRLCFQTNKMEMTPVDNTALQLGTLCDYIKTHTTKPAFGDSQMLFTFLPTNPYIKMELCGDFYDLRIDQRFEVANDELSSICSKFARDIALHKPASQSSTSHNGWASRGVDGNFKFHWSDKTCTHTKNEQDPWWKVDLGREYIVTDVTVINRGEYGDRFKNAEVHVGNLVDIGKNPICHDRIKQAFNGEAVRVQCNPPIPGRYVSVQLYGKGILTVCEVIVNSRVGGLADWCLIENGGCEQLCYNKCDRKTSCGCMEGYQLAYDGKKCLDINECLVNNGGCRTDKHARCINYPGAFYCACDPGYILRDNSKTECMDVNECQSGNGGCEQMCNNTIGGYLCSCREGYERKPNDNYGCQDIDECKVENGGCSQDCANFFGGYYCKCQPGFRLRDDGKTCEEIYCNVLEKPSWGVVQPAICTTTFSNIKIGTKCTFDCSKGYELQAFDVSVPLPNIVGCQLSGLWDKGSPSCHPVKCPPISRPQNGGVTPPSCHTPSGTLHPEFGQRCISYCQDGYRLKGPATRYCQADRTWSTSAQVECVKVYDPPYINCPADITVTLPPDNATYTLGGAYLEPQTSINITGVTPVGAGPAHPFPAGVTAVEYEAISQTGKKFMCRFYVTVKDVTKPKVHNCPADIFKLTSKVFEIVKWTEPTFTDAVGVTKSTTPHIKNGVSWSVGRSVSLLYTASDAANNQATCRFTVTLKSEKCGPLSGDSDAVIQVHTVGVFYIANCKNGRVFFGPFGVAGNSISCSKGDYMMSGQNIGNELPACVGKHLSTATAACPAGSQKFEYDGWFSKEYYCVLCPKGMQHHLKSGKCEKCPKNYYEDEEGSTACEMCPVQHITLSVGSTSVTDCLARCPEGYHSANGYASPSDPCMPCPLNTYADRDGSILCTDCKEGSITLNEGSNSSQMCLAKPHVLKIEPSDSTITVKVGEQIVIHCYTTGDPSPTNKWVKIVTPGGTTAGKFITSDILNMEWLPIGISMYISQATLGHSGTYNCITENALGAASRLVDVKVL